MTIYPGWYEYNISQAEKKLITARTASAAWKKAAKKFYKIAIFRHSTNEIAAGYIDFHKEVASEWKDRADIAEKRVQELEEALDSIVFQLHCVGGHNADFEVCGDEFCVTAKNILKK